MQLLWSANVGTPLRGLALARERGWLLTWDDRHCLHLFERGRQSLRARTSAAPLAAACLADDGSALSAVGIGGEVWFLGPDLQPRWEKKLPQAGQSVALDSFGHFVAASDVGGNLVLFDRQGNTVNQILVPRPLRRLAFIPERPWLVGSADFGLVACLDAKLEYVWRDGLVANVGGLSVSGDGSVIALAGFSTGLYCYPQTGPPHHWQPLPVSCRLVALRYDGKVFLIADPANVLHIVDQAQKTRDEYALPAPVVDVAFGPLGNFVAAALTDGTLMALAPEVRRVQRLQMTGHLLAGQRFLGPARTVSGYSLYDLGDYPGLVLNAQTGGQVEGELYAITPALLTRLDEAEGVPTLYQRKQIMLEGVEQPVIAYLYQGNVASCTRLRNAYDPKT